MSRITRNKVICGGEPIIHGTRITVRDIVEYEKIYQSNERVLKALPHLTLDDIETALDYYRRHRQEIEAYRQAEEESENWTDLPNLFQK